VVVNSGLTVLYIFGDTMVIKLIHFLDWIFNFLFSKCIFFRKLDIVRKNAAIWTKEGSQNRLMSKLAEPFNDLRERLFKLKTAVYGFTIRGFSLPMFTINYMTELRKEVDKKLRQIGFESLAESAEDFYRISFSHLRTSGGDILVILHVPVVETEYVLKLFHVIPIPAPLSIYQHVYEGPNGMVAPILANEMIAISRENKSKEVSYDEIIQKCSIYFGHILCKEFPPLDDGLQDSCLGSLFFGDWEGAHKHCHFGIFSIQEFSVQISETKHIIVTANPLESQIHCTFEQRKESGVNFSNKFFSVKSLTVLSIKKIVNVSRTEKYGPEFTQYQVEIFLNHSTTIELPQGCGIQLSSSSIFSGCQFHQRFYIRMCFRTFIKAKT
jgi:hypothetical protein